MQLIKSVQQFAGAIDQAAKEFAIKALGLSNLTAVQNQVSFQSINQVSASWLSYKVIKAYKVVDIIYAVVDRLATTLLFLLGR